MPRHPARKIQSVPKPKKPKASSHRRKGKK